MVGIYNKNRTAEDAVPVDKIMQITTEYQEGMKEVQAEYNTLSGQLKREEEERNEMMDQIGICFDKLERMEKLLTEKARRKRELESQGEKK
jgi:Mg2+ and Co2+ transporter CorA